MAGRYFRLVWTLTMTANNLVSREQRGIVAKAGERTRVVRGTLRGPFLLIREVLCSLRRLMGEYEP